MSVSTRCPECGKQFELSDRLLGEEFECEKCGEEFVVKDKPRRKRNRSSGSGKTGLLVAGGFVAVLALSIGLYFALRKTPKPVDPKLAQDEVVQVPKKAISPIAKDPVNPLKKDPVVPPKKDPVVETPKKEPPPIEPPKPAPAAWRAKADPGPDMTQGPKNPKASITFDGFSSECIVPSTPSPFVVVRHGREGKYRFDAIDLRTFEKVGSGPVAARIDREVASADGKYVMGYLTGQMVPGKVVWEVVSLEGKNVPHLEIPNTGSPKLRDFLPGDKALTVDDVFRVWNLSSGKIVKEYQTAKNVAKASLTPGRRYVVALCPAAYLWEIRIAATGELVGQGMDRAVNEQTMIRDMCFSPDGTKLAICLHSNNGEEVLLIVDMNTGQKIKSVPLVQNISQVLGHPGSDHGRPLEWLPDGSGWLWFGQIWLDYETGAPIYESEFRSTHKLRRSLIGPDYITTFDRVMTQPSRDRMLVAALPKDKIAVALAKARGSAAIASKGLPPLKPIDESAVKIVAAPAVGKPWSCTPAAIPVSALSEQMPLPFNPDDVLDIVFSNADVGRAVVLHSFPVNAVSPQNQLRADRIDLKTGKIIDQTDLYISEEFRRIHTGKEDPVAPVGGAGKARAALSPDGSRLAVRLASSPGRVDEWDLDSKKHVAGFVPCGERIDWFNLATSDLLLAQDAAARRLSAVRLSDGKRLYALEGANGPVELSPDRKHVAFGTARGTAIADAATGDIKGVIAQSGNAIAFSPDGRELVLRSTQITRWDLTKGTRIDSTNAFIELATQPLIVVGPRHVYSGSLLYDFKLKETPIARYMTRNDGILAANSPDGRIWYVFRNFAPPNPNQKSFLGARTLPDDGLRPLLDVIAAGKVKPVLAKGTLVDVTVKCLPNMYEKEFQNYAEQNLIRQGLKPGPGGLKLEMTATQVALGGSIPYEFFVGNQKQSVNLPARVVQSEGLLKDFDGTLIHKNGNQAAPPRKLVGMDLDKELVAEIWSGAGAWMRTFQLPTDLFRVDGKVEKLPRESFLTKPK